MFYTSRSAVEAFQDCPRYRYNQYFLNGKGLVAKSKSVPLVTGSTVHRGVEHMLCRVRINEPVNVDIAVQEAIREYVDECEREGFRFSGKGTDTDKQQWFTFCEQKALAEGLIRAWAIAELPRIQERYKVLFVERDIEPIEIAPGVWFQAKVDAEFQDKESKDYFNYSLKTMKQWDERAENSYKSDLQGVTEIWAVEEDCKRADKLIDKLIMDLGELDHYHRYPQANIEQISYYLFKKKLGKKVSGVRFCILIKGARYKDTYGVDPELYVTHSPLVRGYKFIGPSSITYAHSYKYPSVANKSGFGLLGKGWDSFNVWEQMGVKEWIDMLASGEIQPELGDVIKKNVVTPVEYFRSEGEIETAIEEVRLQEVRVKTAIEAINGNFGAWSLPMNFDYNNQEKIIRYMLDGTFPHVKKHCEFHFGGPCEYKDLCWKPEVAQDPIGSGLYQIRMPHHEAERRG
jgi:hypothetical protein